METINDDVLSVILADIPDIRALALTSTALYSRLAPTEELAIIVKLKSSQNVKIRELTCIMRNLPPKMYECCNDVHIVHAISSGNVPLARYLVAKYREYIVTCIGKYDIDEKFMNLAISSNSFEMYEYIKDLFGRRWLRRRDDIYTVVRRCLEADNIQVLRHLITTYPHFGILDKDLAQTIRSSSPKCAEFVANIFPDQLKSVFKNKSLRKPRDFYVIVSKVCDVSDVIDETLAGIIQESFELGDFSSVQYLISLGAGVKWLLPLFGAGNKID